MYVCFLLSIYLCVSFWTFDTLCKIVTAAFSKRCYRRHYFAKSSWNKQNFPLIFYHALHISRTCIDTNGHRLWMAQFLLLKILWRLQPQTKKATLKRFCYHLSFASREFFCVNYKTFINLIYFTSVCDQLIDLYCRCSLKGRPRFGNRKFDTRAACAMYKITSTMTLPLPKLIEKIKAMPWACNL